MKHRFLPTFIGIITFSLLASCSAPAKEPQLEEIPFFQSLELEEGQYATILDIADEAILYYVSHDEGNEIYSRSDYIGIWDIGSAKNISTKKLDEAQVPCSGVLWQGDGYFSLMTDPVTKSGQWEIFRMEGDTASLVDSGSSRIPAMELMPCLVRTDTGVAYSYEELSGQGASYGIRRIEEGGESVDLWSAEFDLSSDGNGPVTLFLKENGPAASFFEENGSVGQFRLIDRDGTAQTVPLYHKLYDFCLLKDYFVQSCDEGEFKKSIAVSNLNGEREFSQNVSMCLFRMCGYGGNKFMAVDENFNILMGEVKNGAVELKELEVPLKLLHKAVRIISDGGNSMFLSYMQTASGAKDAALYRVKLNG